MGRHVPFMILGIRVGVAWWALLTALTALFSGAGAFVAAMLLYPPVALMIGAAAAVTQWRATRHMTMEVDPLALGHRQVISVDLVPEQSLLISRSAVDASFGKLEQHETEGALTLRVSPHGALTRWPDRLRTDILTVGVQDHGPARTTLELACEPLHRWWYGFFWVDGGRCASRIETLQRAILARLHAQQQSTEAAAQRDALQTRLAQAELLLLRAQIDPHFLFNTLAHLRACIGSDTAAACNMLDSLVEFLRDSSRVAARSSTSLSEELVRVENYLKLIAMRLDDRLHYTIECDPDLGSHLVPTASVLVLAENAIKHGIERIEGPGTVAVSCHRLEDMLVIDVDNDGPSLSPAGDGGMGLSNLRERLRLGFGAGAQLQIEDRETSGVRASLRIPLTGDVHAR